MEEIGGREEENRLETGLVRDGEHSDGLRELLRERDGVARVRIRGIRGRGDRRSEGVVTRCPHALGVAGREGVGLNSEVAEHGVRAPSPKELDGVGVDPSTEQCRGPTWSERPGRDQGRVDAGVVLHLEGRMAESIGDEAGRHVVPLAVGANVVMERCFRSSIVFL